MLRTVFDRFAVKSKSSVAIASRDDVGGGAVADEVKGGDGPKTILLFRKDCEDAFALCSLYRER